MSNIVQKLEFYLTASELKKVKGLTVDPSVQGLVLTFGIDDQAKISIVVKSTTTQLVVQTAAPAAALAASDSGSSVPTPPGHH
jgi:hypothetical protein